MNYSNGKYNIEVEIWGSGKPFREFLMSKEIAGACVFIMEKFNFSDIVDYNRLNIQDFDREKTINYHLNIGFGEEITICNLAYLINNTFNFKGSFQFNNDKPDGTVRKLTNTLKLDSLGWKNNLNLSSGIKKMSDWYIKDFVN